MNKASIAIFQKTVEYSDESNVAVPNEVFEAAKKVVISRGAEVLRLKDGFYVVQYSETGPFKEFFNDEWMPVYVARISKWVSGGIKVKEIKEFQASHPQGVGIAQAAVGCEHEAS